MIDIKIPYTTSPHMVSLQGLPYRENADSLILQQKKIELSKYGTDLHGMIDDPVSQALVKSACVLTNKTITESVVDFALNFEEDVAIMHRGILQCICFCFPSSWVPSSRVGFSLTDIHEAVADSARLVQASQKIAHAMATAGSFKRHVWTISLSSELNQHPRNKVIFDPETIDQLWFRVETQTTMPLGDGVSSLFFVKVDTYPLAEVFKDQDFMKKVYDSVCSMSDAILDYKGLHKIKNVLESYLGVAPSSGL